MTGRKRVVIVSSGLSRPNSLTLDRKKNRLYWIDSRYRKIEYLDMNQNKRVVLLSSYNLYYSFGLTLLGDYLYWTSGWYSYGVYRADKETGSGVTNFISSTGSLKGIRGYNLSEPFPTGKNKFNEQYRILRTSLNTSPNFSQLYNLELQLIVCIALHHWSLCLFQVSFCLSTQQTRRVFESFIPSEGVIQIVAALLL